MTNCETDDGNDSAVAHLIAVATSYFRDGDYPQAMAVAARAIQLDPDCIEVYNFRVLLAKLLRDESGLVSDATELIRLQPDQATHYRDRADAFTRLGQPERAILDCNKALELAPHYSRAYSVRAYAFALLGRMAESTADIQRSFLLDAKPEQIEEFDRRTLVANLLRRTQALSDVGDHGQAVEACSAILCDEPDHIEARMLRGIAYQGLERFKDSCDDLSRAWELKLEHDRIGRSHIVTVEGSNGERLYSASPDTPQGRQEAEAIAERLAADDGTHEELISFVGRVGMINIYRVEGTEVEKVDWIWIKHDDDGPPEVVNVNLT